MSLLFSMCLFLILLISMDVVFNVALNVVASNVFVVVICSSLFPLSMQKARRLL